MESRSVALGFLGVLSAVFMVAHVNSAPVNIPSPLAGPTQGPDSKIDQIAEVQHQDEDLQDLLNLVNEESQRSGVTLHKTSHLHQEGNTRLQQQESAAVDTKTGDVIADVKQEVTQDLSHPGQEPETVVQTKVDIPAENVHETFVQDSQDDEEVADALEPAPADVMGLGSELTPAIMAEYLYATQQFPAFYSALDSLETQSKMTPEDAQAYAQTVAQEYEKIQLEEFDRRLMAEKRMYAQDFPPASDVYAQGTPVDYAPAPPADMAEGYPPVDMYGYPVASSYMSPVEQYFASPIQLQQQQQQQIQQQQLLQQQQSASDIDPYDFLTALWNEAYVRGNEEAQDIVKMLYERVSDDGNPDDMGQIKDILMNTMSAPMSDSVYGYGSAPLSVENLPPPSQFEIPQEEEAVELPEEDSLEEPEEEGEEEEEEDEDVAEEGEEEDDESEDSISDQEEGGTATEEGEEEEEPEEDNTPNQVVED